jgi:arylsulfatase A-like enzyme
VWVRTLAVGGGIAHNGAMLLGRAALLHAAAAVALLGACGSRHHPDSLLLVTLDTTRADYLGCYGGVYHGTPNLDALAEDGVRFENAIAQAAVTPVSHASIMTGLDPHHHGVRVVYAASGYKLPADVPTLASVLRGHGFATGAFLSSFTVSEFYGLDRGFDTFDNGLGHPTDEVMRCVGDLCAFDLGKNQRRADATTDKAIAWLRAQRGPTFLWVHYWDPHDRLLLPPEELLARYAPPAGAGEPERFRAIYAAEVDYVDQQFGRLRRALRELGRDDDTMIVVVADHGEGLGDHGHWNHRILYQEQIRVPLLVRMPGGPSRSVVTPLVRTIDIYPTVLESLGRRPPGAVDGESMLGLMAGRTEPPRAAYAEALVRFDLNGFVLRNRPNDDLLYAFVELPWKLIYRPTNPQLSELFNLHDDPREAASRLTSDAEVASRLTARLEAMNSFRKEPFGPAPVGGGDALERLRSLGYVE